MPSNLFDQPTWPVAVATLLAAIGTLSLQWILNRRTRRLDENLRIHDAQIGERNAETAAALAEAKQMELANAITANWAGIVEHRTDRLQSDFAELLGLLQVFADEADGTDRDTRTKIAQLGRSISLAIPPSGKFAEELTIQLGHIREAVTSGPGYLAERPGLLWALQTNAWKIVDAERWRVLEAISTGRPIERRELEPAQWRPSSAAVLEFGAKRSA